MLRAEEVAMRILLLTQWYPPEPQKVVSDLAESLQDCGHDVTVLTGYPNYPSGKLYPGYQLRLWQRETLNGVPVIRVPLFPDHSRSGVKRACNYVSFALSSALLGLGLIPRVDLVYVIHPPLTVGFPAWILSRFLRVPFIYEIQDMWPETLRATGMVRSEKVLGIVGRFAKWIYRRAAAIRVISPGFRENLLDKGVPAEKVQVISNWVDTDFYRPVPADPALANRLGFSGRFNVLYAGSIGPAQGLSTVLSAASLLRDVPQVQFVLAGDGIDRQRLQNEAQQQGLTNVRFLGRLPPEEMPGIYALADVLLIHLRADPLFRITIPHKTFTYMASGKPVLAAVEGDVAAVVQSAEAGFTCPPDDAAAMAAGVRRLLALSEAERRRLGDQGRQAACQLYGREPLVRQIACLLEREVAKRASRVRRGFRRSTMGSTAT